MKRSRLRHPIGIWPARAQRLAAVLGMDRLHATAVAAIRARPVAEPIAVTCSGGADSVALLLLLWAHLPERRGRFIVLHFDHRLRGRASTGDARFVAAIARGLGESFHSARWDEAPAHPSEAACRDARWTFFKKALAEGGAQVIALGHQQSDVAETMMMRLARGSGTAGLAAPRPVQRHRDGELRVRPLLALRAEAIRSALRAARVPWREDASNSGDDYLRNRIRRHVLPPLREAADREVEEAISHARELLEEDDAALEAWLDVLISMPRPGEPLPVAALRGRPAALARRAFHRWANGAFGAETPSRAVVEQVVAAIVTGESFRASVGSGRQLIVRDEVVRLDLDAPDLESAKPWPESLLAVGAELVGPRGDRLAARWVKLTPRLRARIKRGDFDPQVFAHLVPPPGWGGVFSVRSWRPGDRYRPLGAPGRRKLQDLFVDRRVPRQQRKLLPVVEIGPGNPVWVPGLIIADAVGIQPTAKLVVQLTYATVPPMVNRPIDHTSNDV